MNHDIAKPAGGLPGATREPAGTSTAVAPDHRYPPLYQSMLAVSLLGSVYGQEDDADVIGNLLAPTLADPTAYRINRALAQGLHGNAAKAEQTLKEILDADPQDDCTKVVLAVSKIFSGDPDWQTVLESVFASSSDPVARNAASNVVACLLQVKP